MGEIRSFGRAGTLALALSTLGLAASGCADGAGNAMPHRDANVGMDTGVVDTGVRDASRDTGPDVPPPTHDAGGDGGPHATVGTCEECTSDLDCDPTSYCAHLVTGQHACLIGC